jgi:hypothetical protein
MSGPLGYTQRQGDFAGGDSRLLGNLTQDKGVIGNEFPSRHNSTSYFFQLHPYQFWPKSR